MGFPLYPCPRPRTCEGWAGLGGGIVWGSLFSCPQGHFVPASLNWLCKMSCHSSPATTTKYHSPVAQKDIYFSQIWRLKSPRSKCQQIQFPVGPSSRLTGGHLLTVSSSGRERGRECSGVSLPLLIRTATPSWGPQPQDLI